MTGRRVSSFALILFIVLSGLVLTASYVAGTSLPSLTIGEGIKNNTKGNSRITNIWFTGDVMLSRQVGHFLSQYGSDYSWRGLTGIFITSTDYTVINFEGCSAPLKRFLYSESFRFPVEESLLEGIRTAGVTHASVANNHAVDCQGSGVASTKSRLDNANIMSFGDPFRIASSSISYLELDNGVVGLIAISTVLAAPDLEAIKMELKVMRKKSDYQVAYIHWGNEYEHHSSPAQRSLATALVSMGIDLIIGHHPHVVQEVERINDVLVFYSLGNLIFDQYFSEAVQQGMVLRLTQTEKSPKVELHPVTSLEARAQPRLMNATEKSHFLKSLANLSDPSLREEIEEGIMRF